jgi:hypothetical protein
MEGQMSFHFNYMKKLLLCTILVSSFGNLWAQNSNYWQQHVDYKMAVTMDVSTYIQGQHKLVYTNNSQDTLRKVYYHLFNNAFQPSGKNGCTFKTLRSS